MYRYNVRIEARQYRWWGFCRFVKRVLAYFVIMPPMLIFFPFAAIGNWLGAAFYKLRR